jgi:hypothetical protein
MPFYQVIRRSEHDPTGHGMAAGVELDNLTSQLIPLRDALLKVFDGIPARRRAEVQRLEVGLSLTERGDLALAAENTKALITLTLGNRQRLPRTRSQGTSGPKPDVVRVEEQPSPTPLR